MKKLSKKYYFMVGYIPNNFFGLKKKLKIMKKAPNNEKNAKYKHI